MPTDTYTIEHTQDEHGEDHYYITDERGDWIEDSYPTREAAAEVIDSGAVPTARYCERCNFPTRHRLCAICVASPGLRGASDLGLTVDELVRDGEDGCIEAPDDDPWCDQGPHRTEIREEADGDRRAPEPHEARRQGE